MNSAAQPLPLDGIKVLDLSRVRAGPTCVRQLADWGADVLMVELPQDLQKGEGMGGPRHGPDFQNLHRNKRSMTLNLKHPEGLAILRRLVENADVVVDKGSVLAAAGLLAGAGRAGQADRVLDGAF